MAGKLVLLDEAASMLGISTDDVLNLRQSGKLYGYRDGTSWKFKVEDLEAIKHSPGGLKADDIVLPIDEGKDEFALPADFSLDETKSAAKPSAGSDLKLDTGSGINLGALSESGPSLASPSGVEMKPDSGLNLGFDSSPKMTGASDVKLAEDSNVLGNQKSDLDLAGSKTVIKSGSGMFGGSSINLSGDNLIDSKLGSGSSLNIGEDHEDVLGGSGSGSDITHRTGDSGILLFDPADSGLALDKPLELGGSDKLTTEFQGGSATDLQTENDFLLKPLEEDGDEDSSSGSQVIMIDESPDEVTSTLMNVAVPGGLLDEGVGGLGPLGGLTDMGAAAGAGPAGGVVIPPGMVVVPRENPFGALSVVGLMLCTVLLAVGGIMMYDLVRNVWSWDQTYPLSSKLMNAILGVK